MIVYNVGELMPKTSANWGSCIPPCLLILRWIIIGFARIYNTHKCAHIYIYIHSMILVMKLARMIITIIEKALLPSPPPSPSSSSPSLSSSFFSPSSSSRFVGPLGRGLPFSAGSGKSKKKNLISL